MKLTIAVVGPTSDYAWSAWVQGAPDPLVRLRLGRIDAKNNAMVVRGNDGQVLAVSSLQTGTYIENAKRVCLLCWGDGTVDEIEVIE